MMIRFFLFLRAAIVFLIIFTCIPEPQPPPLPPPIDHQALIGTKWHLSIPHLDLDSYIVFIDEEICHKFIEGIPYPRAYTIKGHKIVFDGIIYELKDNTLCRSDVPHWVIAD